MSDSSPLQTVTNSETTAKPTRGRPFPRGVSGNPAGRPRKLDALADAIRRHADPDELAQIALTIARTSKQEALRLQALAWLRDSGYARPAAQHVVAMERTDTPQRDWSAVPLSERLDLLRRLRAVPELSSGQQPDGVTDDNEAQDGAPCPERGQ